MTGGRAAPAREPRLLVALRSHPAHVLIGCGVAGLLAGPRVPWALALALAALAGVVPRGCTLRLACVAMVLGGAAWSQARLDVLDRAVAVPAGADGTVLLPILEESPRPSTFGWRALAHAGGERVLIRGRGAAPGWWPGDQIRAAGRLRELGEHDGWLRARHVQRVLDARFARLTGARRGGVSGGIDDVRRRAARALGARLPSREGALLRGMTLGDESGLPRSSLDALRAAGLGHIVAASGQNVALLALLVQAIGALAGLGLRTRHVLTLALVALYVPLAGGGPSIQRAAVMGAAAIVAALAARPAARWHALLLAAGVTLALDPASPAQPGWVLSFAAVAAIALLFAPISGRLERRGLPRPLAGALALTLAATIGTAPVSAAFFGTVSLAGLLANVLVAPVIAPITWTGMLAAALAQAWPAGGAVLAGLSGPALAFVLGVADALGGLGAAQIDVAAPPVAAACIVAALLAGPPAPRRACLTALRSVRARPRAVAAPVLSVTAAVLVLAWPALRGVSEDARGTAPVPADALRISFLDIGQGDATLLQSGSASLLVDTGPAGGPILRELRAAGARRLSALLATHAQSDHLGAADAVLNALPVGLLVDGRDGVRERNGRRMALAAHARGVRSAVPHAGDQLKLGALRADVLWPAARPPGPPAAAGDPNDRAVVLLVRAAGIRVLLTADAESDVLARLSLPQVDVLKVSHHGSADDGLPALLGRLRPRVAVIEVGAGNTYGHPVPATVAALHASGARVLRTDRDGTVVLEARAGRITTRTER